MSAEAERCNHAMRIDWPTNSYFQVSVSSAGTSPVSPATIVSAHFHAHADQCWKQKPSKGKGKLLPLRTRGS